MNIWRGFGLILGLLLILNLARAQTPAEFDFPRLNPQARIGSYLEGERAARLYQFSARRGDDISAEMTQAQGSPLDPFLLIISAEGTLIASDDDSGGVIGAALIYPHELFYTGDYFILATTYHAHFARHAPLPSRLAYTLNVRGFEQPDPQAEFLHFDPPFIMRGETRAFESKPTQPIVWLYFSGQAGEQVTLDMQSEAFDGLLFIFDREGWLIAANDDRTTDEHDPNPLIADFELPYSGDYLIMATGYHYTSANTMTNPANPIPPYSGLFSLSLR